MPLLSIRHLYTLRLVAISLYVSPHSGHAQKPARIARRWRFMGYHATYASDLRSLVCHRDTYGGLGGLGFWPHHDRDCHRGPVSTLTAAES
ncbi:hypothetical protein BZA05DRAFT_236569 [Tricharina praecox]|uniref:uncharacterized protein n=1 Tax=Tricharina praecox TaxID=43433 RepID=UPI00221E5E74|nr:uncharacterized protein BZA05DRAFT_236569 [Tricharina praecox]KAI5855303.1 hypothetical protein BZA05DRAFT_236569 [Tricharina praecox]